MAESGQYRSNLLRIMIIATLGGLLFGYDTGVVNGALPFMAAPDQLNLDPLQEGMVVSALLVGAAVGSFCGGRLADYQGRKTNILWLAVIFFVSTLGCSLAPSFHVMLVSRFVLGLAVGGASVTVPAYLAEISPAERRGRMVTQNELMIVTGQFLAFLINAIIAVAMEGENHVWRYMLSVAALPAVLLFFGIQGCPESPRWLITKGRSAESLEILKKIRATADRAAQEVKEIEETLEKAAKENAAALSEINQPWVRRIIYIAIGIACFSQTTGVNSVMYYGSTILNEAGFSRQASIIANTLNGLASVIGTSTGIYLMTKMHRRTMLTVGFCITTFSLLMIAILAMTMSGNPIFPYLVLGCTVLFLLGMQGAIGPILWLSISEIIPLRFRGKGMGLAILFVWVTNFIIGLFFPTLLDSFGLQTTFIIFAVIGFIAIAFTRLFVPETFGKTLEEIEHQFRNYNRAEIQSPGRALNEH